MQQNWIQNGVPPQNMDQWDAHYRARAAEHPEFIITKALVPPRLTDPPVFFKSSWESIFNDGRVPVTRRYEILNDAEFELLMHQIA
jgi:hypothetical protein